MMKLLRELLLGPAYFYHRYLIKKSKNWSILQIESYELDKINIDKTKFTTKSDIRKNPKKYLKKSLLIPIRQVRTGGTSGTPFKFFQDLIFTRQKERAYLFDIWSHVDYQPFDYKIVVRGNIPKNAVKYSFIDNSLIISQNYFIIENKSKLTEIFDNQEFFLHIYPSTLMFLIDFFGDKQFKKFKIKGVLAGSEAFPIQQMNWFKNKFDIPIAHWYGHSEYAILARFCNCCQQFHFYPTYGKMQLLNEENNYKILATGFNRYGTQFNNYFTGDYGIPSSTECSIDNFEKVKSIVGREQDFVIDKFGVKRAFGPLLFGIHNEFWDYILDIQFLQKERGVIKVLYIPSKIFNETLFKKILVERFELFLLEYLAVNELEKTISGKRVYFRQNLGV